MFDLGNIIWEYYLYIMTEQYRTIGRARFSSSTARASQNCTMFNIKSAVPEFPRWPMIVSLYYSSISKIYTFMFVIQLMVVTPSKNAKTINEMAWYFYFCGLLFGTNNNNG